MIEDYELTEEERLMWDWQYERFGDFYKYLMKALCHADTKNQDRLSLGFPDLVSGYQKYSHQEGWWERAVKKHDARFEVERIKITDRNQLPLIAGQMKTEIGIEYLSHRLKEES